MNALFSAATIRWSVTNRKILYCSISCFFWSVYEMSQQFWICICCPHFVAFCFLLVTAQKNIDKIWILIKQYRFPSLFAGVTFLRNCDPRIPNPFFKAYIRLKLYFFPLYSRFSPVFWFANSHAKPWIPRPQITRVACN